MLRLLTLLTDISIAVVPRLMSMPWWNFLISLGCSNEYFSTLTLTQIYCFFPQIKPIKKENLKFKSSIYLAVLLLELPFCPLLVLRTAGARHMQLIAIAEKFKFDDCILCIVEWRNDYLFVTCRWHFIPFMCETNKNLSFLLRALTT